MSEEKQSLKDNHSNMSRRNPELRWPSDDRDSPSSLFVGEAVWNWTLENNQTSRQGIP